MVVHCKAGKGRSGTASVSYLISEEGWTKDDALKRFTERRMRPGFGAGVSIPSQLRWVDYVERWARNGKMYIERKVEVTEIRMFGLRDGVRVSVEGFEDEGKVIKTFHVFGSKETKVTRGEVKEKGRLADVVAEMLRRTNTSSSSSSIQRSSSQRDSKKSNETSPTSSPVESTASENNGAASPTSKTSNESGTSTPKDPGGDVVLRPSKPIIVLTSDLNIDFERRTTAAYSLTMVTSVAHVWFNVFFEGQGPENFSSGTNGGQPFSGGVFEIEWEKLDGIKGSSRKGTKSFDKVAISWKVIDDQTSHPVMEPEPGEEVHQTKAADWRGRQEHVDEGHQKDLGIKKETPSTSCENVDKTAESTPSAAADAANITADQMKQKAGDICTAPSSSIDHAETPPTNPMGQAGEERVETPKDTDEKDFSEHPSKSKTLPADMLRKDKSSQPLSIPDEGDPIPARTQSPDSMPEMQQPQHSLDGTLSTPYDGHEKANSQSSPSNGNDNDNTRETNANANATARGGEDKSSSLSNAKA